MKPICQTLDIEGYAGQMWYEMEPSNMVHTVYKIWSHGKNMAT